MLKVGIVGCGGIGLIHSKAYQSHPNAQLVCVCDIVKEKADARAEMLDVKAYKTMRNVIKEFSNHIWQSFKRLPRRLLNQSLLDCLNRKPECCELFQSEVSKLLVEWVKGLKPGWKKGNPLTSSLKWRQMQRDIKRKITDLLRACLKRSTLGTGNGSSIIRT